MKRLNPQTGKPFKHGDVREDGYMFSAYKNVIKKDGFFGEKWVSPKSFEKKKVYKNSWYNANKEKTAARGKAWREANREYFKAWYKANKERHCAYVKVQYEANKERKIAYSKAWAEANKAKRAAAKKAWNAANPEKRRSQKAKRRAAKLQRTPAWLSKDQLRGIEDFYTIAQMFKLYTGLDYHVDHIVPLLGANVSGLHVPWNLQVLPASENLSKNNSHDA